MPFATMRSSQTTSGSWGIRKTPPEPIQDYEDEFVASQQVCVPPLTDRVTPCSTTARVSNTASVLMSDLRGPSHYHVSGGASSSRISHIPDLEPLAPVREDGCKLCLPLLLIRVKLQSAVVGLCTETAATGKRMNIECRRRG